MVIISSLVEASPLVSSFGVELELCRFGDEVGYCSGTSFDGDSLVVILYTGVD
jgi:hypothetical protein